MRRSYLLIFGCAAIGTTALVWSIFLFYEIRKFQNEQYILIFAPALLWISVFAVAIYLKYFRPNYLIYDDEKIEGVDIRGRPRKLNWNELENVSYENGTYILKSGRNKIKISKVYGNGTEFYAKLNEVLTNQNKIAA